MRVLIVGGSGRIGRLLITLLFQEWDVLSAPVLYLSLYFKTNREAYYERVLNDPRLASPAGAP